MSYVTLTRLLNFPVPFSLSQLKYSNQLFLSPQHHPSSQTWFYVAGYLENFKRLWCLVLTPRDPDVAGWTLGPGVFSKLPRCFLQAVEFTELSNPYARVKLSRLQTCQDIHPSIPSEAGCSWRSWRIAPFLPLLQFPTEGSLFWLTHCSEQIQQLLHCCIWKESGCLALQNRTRQSSLEFCKQHEARSQLQPLAGHVPRSVEHTHPPETGLWFLVIIVSLNQSHHSPKRSTWWLHLIHEEASAIQKGSAKIWYMAGTKILIKSRIVFSVLPGGKQR